MIKFMIKYGKKEHLEQILNGSLRVSPAKTYVGIEMNQHNKGQGDLLEGKFKIHFENAHAFTQDTDQLLGVYPKGTVTVNIPDVTGMPMFCLSWYDERYVLEDGRIRLYEDDIAKIHKDFPDATHALVISEPEKFISDIRSIKGHTIIDDKIHYYDYDINTLQMFFFLTTGSEDIKKDAPCLSMTYENRYRHLLCKDKYFEGQREYRFIGMDESINSPVAYSLNKFSSKYVILPIDDLRNPCKID